MSSGESTFLSDAPLRRILLNFIVMAVFAVSLYPAVTLCFCLIRWVIPQVSLSWWVVLVSPFVVYVIFLVAVLSLVLVSGVIIRLFRVRYEPGRYRFAFAEGQAWRWIVFTSLYTPVRHLFEAFPVGPAKNIYFRLIGMKMGENTLMGGVVKDPCLTEFGKDCTVGEFAVLYGHIQDYCEDVLLLDRIRVGDGCVIGAGAFIMPGAILEDNVVVAAGSVVRKGQVLKQGKAYGGVPAKEIPSKQVTRASMKK